MNGMEKSAGPCRQRQLEEDLIELLFEEDRFSHIGRMMRGLTHNINGPLQNMSMLVEMLIREHMQLDLAVQSIGGDFLNEWNAAAARQRKRIERLPQQVSAISEMLQDFMILQEIEQNEAEVDVNLVLKKLAGIFRADLFFKHQVDFELRLTQNLPLVRILGRHIVPALMHLFENALIALREVKQKKLVLESRKLPGCIHIAVLDSGSGPDLTQGEDVLFDLFCSRWPTSIPTEKNEKHFGFGLFAVRRLLDPYGVKVSLVREEDMTAALLEIPVS
ncbi:MAG: hypothetical protein AB2L11_12110 [Syntrophobacteraceae bacterium]